MIIFNKYKNILDVFIDNPNSESLNYLKPIYKKSCNIFRSKSGLTDFLKEDCLNKNILTSNRLSQQAPKIGNSQLYQHRNVIPIGPKTEKTQYEKY